MTFYDLHVFRMVVNPGRFLPSSSCPVERTFSYSKKILTEDRQRFDVETLKHLVVSVCLYIQVEFRHLKNRVFLWFSVKNREIGVIFVFLA